MVLLRQAWVPQPASRATRTDGSSGAETALDEAAVA